MLAALPVIWFSLEDYQRGRIFGFLSPDKQAAGWQAEQSIVAIGAGQILGKGYMQSSQARMKFLPEHWTDFPFAVLAEEWGFVGCLVLLGCYFFLVLWALNIASQAPHRIRVVARSGRVKCSTRADLPIPASPPTSATRPCPASASARAAASVRRASSRSSSSIP